MDTVTHTVIGACLGEAIAGRQLGKKAMLIGAIANNLPDIDVIANAWASETGVLLLHRGITHAILTELIFTPLLAWIGYKLFRKYDVSFRRWLALTGSGLFLHILVDAFTAYGTGWFEPFSHHRVSLNSIFILDPLLTFPALVAAVGLLILRKDSPKRMQWAKAGILCFGIYLLFVNINKIMVNRVVENNLTVKNIRYDDYMATPTPLNNFLWYIVARSHEGYYIGYYSVFDKDENISFEKIARNDSLLKHNCDPRSVQDLIRFSQQYYCANVENDTIVFSDLRFGQLGGWYRQKAPFVFNFKLAQNCSNKTALQKGRFESLGSETTIQLFKRIKGKTDPGPVPQEKGVIR
jgi:inner membrane protein